MSTFEQNTDYDLILFGHDVLDTDVKVGRLPQRLRTKGSVAQDRELRFPITEPICNATLREQFVYRCLPTFVPDLFEPAADESFIGFCHDAPLRQ